MSGRKGSWMDGWMDERDEEEHLERASQLLPTSHKAHLVVCDENFRRSRVLFVCLFVLGRYIII